MDHLPLNDIPMLVSTINFLLRDEEFDNLDQICNCSMWALMRCGRLATNW